MRRTLLSMADSINIQLTLNRPRAGVLAEKGVKEFHNLQEPVGGGINSRLDIHTANNIALQEGSHVDYIRVMPQILDEEFNEDMIAHLQEIIMTQFGAHPG